jgi:hypothetical protein
MNTFLVAYLKKIKSVHGSSLWNKSIAAATEQNSEGVLSRIFNTVPLIFEGFTPFNPEFTTRSLEWLTEVASNEDDFPPHANEVGVFTIEKHVRIKIKALTNEMVSIACTEILDNNGEIKAEIIGLLDLKPLIQKWQQEKKFEKIKGVSLQLISSYLTQILLGTLGINLYGKNKPEAEVKRIGLITREIQNLLGHGIGPAFIKKVEGFSYFDKSLPNGFAANLSNFPMEDLKEIVRQDVQPLVSQQTALQVQYANDLHRCKMSFWNDVANYLTANENLQLANAVTQALEDAKPKPVSILATFAFFSAPESPVYKKNPLDAEKILRNWINVRDNFCTIDSVISYFAKNHVNGIFQLAVGHRLDGLLGYVNQSDADKKILQALKQSRFDGEMILKPTKDLLMQHFLLCHDGSEVKKVLQNFLDGLQVTEEEINAYAQEESESPKRALRA